MHRTTFKAFVLNAILLLFFGAGISNVYAGSMFLSKRVSIDVKNQTVEQVLHTVEVKASVLFMYNPQMFNAKRKLSLQLHASVQEVLQHVINNKDVVFYELNNYIVITTKREAPKQIQYVSAALADDGAKMQFVDTVRIFDTVLVHDTVRFSYTDTVRVYDTVTIEKPKQTNPNKSADNGDATKPETLSTVNNRNFFVTTEIGPQYSDMLPDASWLSDLSFTARGSLGCKWDNFVVSLGVGMLWQRGGSVGTRQVITRDSVLASDTARVMQRYKKGDYWYYNGTDSVRQTIYDSVMVVIPYTWYKPTVRDATVDSSVAHSILWISIPCRVGYEWAFTRKTTLGINICALPAFAVQRTGAIYDKKAASYRTVNEYGLRSFSLMLAFEPSVSYALTKKISLQLVPVLQLSATSLFASSAHYIGFGSYVGIRKMF